MPVPECKKGLPYKFNTYEEVLLASPVSLVYLYLTCITTVYTVYTENLKKHLAMTHSVSDNLKSRDASASNKQIETWKPWTCLLI